MAGCACGGAPRPRHARGSCDAARRHPPALLPAAFTGPRLRSRPARERRDHEEKAGLFYVDKSVGGIADDTLARLTTFPRVLISSHQGYFTRTAVGQIVDATVRNIDDYLAGRVNENTLVSPSAGDR
ncbi:hypothetical protein GCM10010393_34740 [Streptomyces gobitricini]|uniref:D-isomer specific 2-hydroxyacid dehydrogenase NAD-binding domain-containing protein n=1 Tax=Streptomyces gobitricini TaxID=68211 RepID=A0ABN3MCR9_9ACTN